MILLNLQISKITLCTSGNEEFFNYKNHTPYKPLSMAERPKMHLEN